jgi:hypothetical protein
MRICSITFTLTFFMLTLAHGMQDMPNKSNSTSLDIQQFQKAVNLFVLQALNPIKSECVLQENYRTDYSDGLGQKIMQSKKGGYMAYKSPKSDKSTIVIRVLKKTPRVGLFETMELVNVYTMPIKKDFILTLSEKGLVCYSFKAKK